MHTDKQEVFKKQDVVLIDGTFKSITSCFYPLLSLKIFAFQKSQPFIYILNSNKTEESYYQLWEM